MANIAILGANWGDEAKAKCTHYFSPHYSYIVRFSSGSNSGHTLYHNGQKIVRHLIPSADFSQPHTHAFLGAGMVIDLEELLTEVLETETWFPGSAQRIIVDPDAFVVLPKHIEEDKATNAHIGSTNKGITPAYCDKIARVGTKVRAFVRDKADVIQKLQKLGVQFKYVLELKEQMERSKLLFEGSQSIQLDLNFGDYPFVTSGECGLGGIYNAGFAFAPPTKVYGVAKPYVTKAGGGKSRFVTELSDEESAILRELGGEIGATTGRPRRIGALDLPALRYSVIKGGITHLIMSKLDIMNGIPEIKTCYDYGTSIWCGQDWGEATPHYIMLPGWKDARDIEQIMPFIQHIEQYLGIPVEYVSVGTSNKDMIKLDIKRSTSTTKLVNPFDLPPNTKGECHVETLSN